MSDRRPSRILVLLAIAAGLLALLALGSWWFASPPLGSAGGDGEREGVPPSAADERAAGGALAAGTASGPTGSAAERQPTAVETEPALARTLKGRVVDEAARPIAGATIELLQARPALFRARVPLGFATAAGADGTFALDWPPGVPGLEVEAAAPGRIRATRAAELGAARTVDVGDLLLAPGLELRGLVVSGADGSPLAQAEVRVDLDARMAPSVVRIDSAPLYSAIGDGAGRFRIDGLDFTQYRIELRAPGHAPLALARSFLTQRGRAFVEQRFELEPLASRIRGRVLRADGAPVANAEVEAVAEPGGPDAHRASATSDAAGNFELAPLAQRPYALRARAPDLFPAERVVAPPGAEDVELRLLGAAAVSGRVSLASGGAPTAFRVEALWAPGPGVPRGVAAIAAARAGGAFELDGLEPGRYFLRATAVGAARLVGAPFELAPGERKSGVELSLPAGGTIRGRALDSSGAPLSGAAAVLLTADFDPARPLASALFPEQDAAAVTDAAGDYALAHVAAGTYSVELDHPRGGPVLFERVAVGDGEVTDLGAVAVPEGGTLSGRALDPDGAPLPGTLVLASCPGSRYRREASAANDGSFRFERLPPGQWLIELIPPDAFRTGEFELAREVELAEGATADATVRIARR